MTSLRGALLARRVVAHREPAARHVHARADVYAWAYAGADPAKDVAKWTWQGTPANLAVPFQGLDELHPRVENDEGLDVADLHTDWEKAKSQMAPAAEEKHSVKHSKHRGVRIIFFTLSL